MIRTADGKPVLDPQETEVTDLLLQIVTEDQSLSFPQAAQYALSVLPHPDPTFVAWVTRGDSVEIADTARS